MTLGSEGEDGEAEDFILLMATMSPESCQDTLPSPPHSSILQDLVQHLSSALHHLFPLCSMPIVSFLMAEAVLYQ